MKIFSTTIDGCFEIETVRNSDFRGEFSRVYCQKELANAGIDFKVVQSNFSKTLHKATIRGMHFQTAPNIEAKIVRVEKGSVFDVCLDLRRGSSTFGMWHGVALSEENGKMLLIPKGCAHGFQSLQDNCEMVYLHDQYYSPETDRTVNSHDPFFKITWPLPVSIISDKDKNALFVESNFKGIDL